LLLALRTQPVDLPARVLPVSFKITDEYLSLSCATRFLFLEKDLEATATVSDIFKLLLYCII
jgi:hypothetical protein